MPVPPLHRFNSTPSDNKNPTLHLAHANGFPPGVYTEYITHLAEHYSVVSLPARPLWEPPPPPENMASWHDMAEDLLTGLEYHRLTPVIGVGHSMGGVATILSSIRRPEWFRAIVLIDPVIMSRRALWMIRLLRFFRPNIQYPLTRQALRRRRQWASREAAFERFHGRSIFARWPDTALWNYIDSVTRPADDETEGIVLRYPPEWEARIYQTIPLEIWRYVPKISVPALVIRGEETDTFSHASAQLWQKLRPDIPVITISAAGHLLPIERPAEVARQTLTFLNNLALHHSKH
jgi:pimeloyl-ACP methyl ester carboxylesterase